MHRITALLTATVLVATSASAQQINLPPRDNVVFVFGWGASAVGQGGDYGQTFTALAGYNELDQFSFVLGGTTGEGNNPQNLLFRAYITAFNPGNNTAGAVLFTSAVQSGNGDGAQHVYSFNTGGIAVTAGTKYFAFVDASDYVAAGGGKAYMGSDYLDFATPYAGGDFCSNNNINGNFANTQNTSWVCGKGDIAFTATFSENNQVNGAPEPATLVLLGSGLIGVAGLARRRRRTG